MIAVIHSPRKSFGGTIYYMERKVSMGKGELLDTSLYEKKNTLYWKEFSQIASQNKNVTNKCLHFSLNLPVGESISNEKFKELGKRYMDKMGYSDCPYLFYVHNDKKHSHLHIITSAVDYNGKWVDDSFSNNRSFSVCRQLEDELTLSKLEATEPSKEKTKHFSMKERALLDNSFKNGLRRALADGKAKNYLLHHIPQEEINLILKDADNNTCKFILGERFNYLNDYLMDKGYCTKHLKGELLSILDEAHKHSTKDDFFQHLEANGVSVSLFSREGKTKYSFSLINYDYSFRETKLPKNYTYKSLTEHYGSFVGTYVPESEQKHILYNTFRTSLQESVSLNDFFSKLNQSNISYHFNQDASKTSINLNLNGIQNSKTFDSESIFNKFSYSSINDYFNNRTSISSLTSETVKGIAIQQEAYYPDFAPFLSIPSLSSSSSPHEDNSLFMRKKKKKKGINLDQSNG